MKANLNRRLAQLEKTAQQRTARQWVYVEVEDTDDPALVAARVAEAEAAGNQVIIVQLSHGPLLVE